MIVPGETSQQLGAALARETGRDLAQVSFERFPDGELLAAAPGFDGDRATIVAATTTAEAHIQLLQLQDAVREAGATHVTTVIPYLGYARQDRPMEPGESVESSRPGYPLSVRAVARAISTGTDRVVVVTPHETDVIDHFTVPATSVSGTPPLAEALPDDLVDPVFLAPDTGARSLASALAEAYGRGTVDHFEKTRHSGDTVTITPHNVSVNDRDIVIIDDIIATGSTMSEAIEQLGTAGADRIIATCVHAQLTGAAHTRLARAGVDRVIGTDTIEGPISTASVAPVIAAQLEDS